MSIWLAVLSIAVDMVTGLEPLSANISTEYSDRLCLKWDGKVFSSLIEFSASVRSIDC